MKKYLLETDLSEENWTRLPFKDDMLIHVKKAFSQEDRAGGKAPVLHSYGLICTYIQDITAKYWCQDLRLKEKCFVDFLIFFYGVEDVLFLIAFNWHFISPLKTVLECILL